MEPVSGTTVFLCIAGAAIGIGLIVAGAALVLYWLGGWG